ncbi:MAG: antibiotic biosynthesis monooxygenase [Chloroflexi bacterium]|nr:antibiotic biosynthesis monooxygenase [Chloroflexota bacterium]
MTDMEEEMYVRHATVTVAPGRFERFAAGAKNSLSVMARQEGLVQHRLLRSARLTRPSGTLSIRDGEGKRGTEGDQVISIATWRSEAECKQALGSLEIEMALAPVRQERLVANVVQKDYTLHDVVWGRRGVEGLASALQVIRHIEVDVFPEKFDKQWVPWVRNFLSVFARQKGVLGEEVYRSVERPYHLIAMRIYADRAAATAPVSIEETTAARMTKEGNVYAGPPASVECSLLDMVWGPRGVEEMEKFMGKMENT